MGKRKSSKRGGECHGVITEVDDGNDHRLFFVWRWNSANAFWKTLGGVEGHLERYGELGNPKMHVYKIHWNADTTSHNWWLAGSVASLHFVGWFPNCTTCEFWELDSMWPFTWCDVMELDCPISYIHHISLVKSWTNWKLLTLLQHIVVVNRCFMPSYKWRDPLKTRRAHLHWHRKRRTCKVHMECKGWRSK